METTNNIRKWFRYFTRFFCLAFLTAALMLPVSKREAQAATLGSVTVRMTTVKTTSVTISWNKLSGVGGYQIYRQSVDGQPYQRIKVVSSSVNKYTDAGLKTGKGYRYRVRAYKKVNGSYIYSTYNTLQVITVPETPTAAVTGTTSNSVSLKWTSSPRVTAYRIYRRLPGGSWKRVKDVPANTLTYTDKSSDLKSGTTYQYKVRAYRTVGAVNHYSGNKILTATTARSESTGSTAKLTPAQKIVMKNILYAVESGGLVYGKCNYSEFIGPGHNTPNEVAITIGAGQWYATEAQTLLKKIYTSYPSTFKSYDKDGSLWKDVQNKSWSTYSVSKTSTKGKAIINIMSSPQGIKCQDELMIEQIEENEVYIRNKYGVMNAKAMMECLNIYHQGGDGALSRILGKTAKPYTADRIYATLNLDPDDKTNNNQVGDYTSRQKAVYTFINQYA